jgi:hypothetical protein
MENLYGSDENSGCLIIYLNLKLEIQKQKSWRSRFSLGNGEPNLVCCCHVEQPKINIFLYFKIMN